MGRTSTAKLREPENFPLYRTVPSHQGRTVRFGVRPSPGAGAILTAQATQIGTFEALVDAVAKRRDREAFTRLFDHFVPRLRAYLIRLGADPGTAEEVTQETMVTLWRKAAQFDSGRSSLPTWLYRIARNCRIDRLRRDRLDFVDVTDPVLERVDETDFVSQVDMQQREEAVRIALKGLPEEQLLMVRLAFFDGLSHSEISDRIGLPLGTVKSRIRLGFTRLRRSLAARGVAEAG